MAGDQYPDQAQHPSRVGAFLPSCSAGESPGLSPLMESAPLQRERLHAERPEEIQSSTAKVADVTTANLEAWRHYVQGLRGEDAMRNGIALDEYRKAERLVLGETVEVELVVRR